MRSRPQLTVRLAPARPAPGERLRVLVTLHSQSVTPYDGIDLELVGNERRYARTSHTNDTSVRYYHRREIVRLAASFPAGQLDPGEHTREVDFPLPADAPPSYHSIYSEISYELSVRVRIPWWPDRHETYVITIQPRAVRPPPPTPRVFTSQAGEHRSAEPLIELSLEQDHLAAGGELRGAVALAQLGSRKLRRIELALSAIETTERRTSAGPAEIARHAWVLLEGTPADGTSLPFRLALPPDLVPTFRSALLRVDYALEVVAVVAFGRDLSLRAPVTVARHDRPAPAPSAPVPLVGRARHAAVFREVLASSPALPIVESDPEQARVVLSVRGVRVTVTEEHRADLGVCLVADLDWPSLGLDLRVAERSWTDLGGRLDGLDPRVQKRFRIQAREPAQAAHLLDDAVLDALAAFDEVALDDQGAVVVRKGGVHRASGLQRFLGLAHLLAQRLAAAIASLPPPAALAAALPAYRRFAEQNGATLRPGDLALEGLERRGARLSLVHRFEHGAPVDSQLWTALPDDLATDAWLDSLRATLGHPVLRAPGRLGLTLPLCDDPEGVLPLAEALAAEISARTGTGRGGPYR